jgi:hypothetical protein
VETESMSRQVKNEKPEVAARAYRKPALTKGPLLSCVTAGAVSPGTPV